MYLMGIKASKNKNLDNFIARTALWNSGELVIGLIKAPSLKKVLSAKAMERENKTYIGETIESKSRQVAKLLLPSYRHRRNQSVLT